MSVILLMSVFMAPETAVCPPWREIFKSPFFSNNLAVVSVDEAHCIHEWLVSYGVQIPSLLIIQ